MNFKLYDCDIGFKVAGVAYDFTHVNKVDYEDGERNSLTRGANAKDKTGIPFKEGLKDPKKFTIDMMQMSKALKAVFDSCFDSQTRIEFYCVARSDGSSRFGKQALLANKPTQLGLDDTPDSMNVSLEVVTYDVSEDHKS